MGFISAGLTKIRYVNLFIMFFLQKINRLGAVLYRAKTKSELMVHPASDLNEDLFVDSHSTADRQKYF
jgi:hypothetical protein